MGDLKEPKGLPSSLPPGFRFLPTEHQIFTYYLNCKNINHDLSSPSTSNNPNLSFDVIREIDLYNYDPCDLPEITAFPFGHGGSKKHWYCYTVKVKSEGSKRKAKSGFWKRKGRSRDVLGGKEGSVTGKKSKFVFHRGNLSNSCRTNWVMIEYALVDHHQKASFVLCRVFLKSCSGNRMAKHVPSSCAEESIAATHNICIDVPYKQRDGASTSRIGGVAMHEDTLFHTNNDLEQFPLKPSGEPDDPIVAGPVFDNGFQSSMVIPQSDHLVKSSDMFIGGGIVFGDVVGDELMTNLAILEGDFIELDDLVSPLPDFNSSG